MFVVPSFVVVHCCGDDGGVSVRPSDHCPFFFFSLNHHLVYHSICHCRHMAILCIHQLCNLCRTVSRSSQSFGEVHCIAIERKFGIHEEVTRAPVALFTSASWRSAQALFFLACNFRLLVALVQTFYTGNLAATSHLCAQRTLLLSCSRVSVFCSLRSN